MEWKHYKNEGVPINSISILKDCLSKTDSAISLKEFKLLKEFLELNFFGKVLQIYFIPKQNLFLIEKI